jgi:hypothetical protein
MDRKKSRELKRFFKKFEIIFHLNFTSGININIKPGKISFKIFIIAK